MGEQHVVSSVCDHPKGTPSPTPTQEKETPGPSVKTDPRIMKRTTFWRPTAIVAWDLTSGI